MPVCVPCRHNPRAPGGSRTHATAIPRRQAPATTRGHHHPERPVGVEPTHPPWQGDRQPLHHGRGRSHQSIRRGSHPRRHFGRVACCCYTTDASPTSGSGGSRTHVIPLKRRVPRRRRTHETCQSLRCARKHSHLPYSTPCGSRTRPRRLERPPTSPEVERGCRYQKRNRPGVCLTPGRRVFRDWRRGYPLVSSTLPTRRLPLARVISARPPAGGRQVKFIARVPEGHGEFVVNGVSCSSSWVVIPRVYTT